MNIAITGASGLIGSALTARLSDEGHLVTLLTRSREVGGENRKVSHWDPMHAEIIGADLEGIDVAINLAGATIAARWTRRHKQEIRDSRVLSTRLLSEALAGLRRPPRLLLSASATGFYGPFESDKQVDEADAAGSGFLASVCREWEQATVAAEQAAIRVIHFRLGMVLSSNGGALARMLPLFRKGLGGKIGSGKQMVSWIALPEIYPAIMHLVSAEQISGAVNLVSPNAVSNEEFANALADAVGRPAPVTVRPFMAKLAFGEMAEEVLLAGVRALPTKLLASGYQFNYPELSQTLAMLLQGT